MIPVGDTELETLVVPHVIAERIRREAKKAGMTLEEYLIELISQNLDPKDKVREYLEASRELLEQANEELKKGDIRQAAEKIWGATALAIKAHAYSRERRRLTDHRELWEYKNKVADELGDWVRSYFDMRAPCIHVFYEGWYTKRDVEDVLTDVRKLIEAISRVILKSNITT